MKKTFVNLLCLFIPSRSVRHNLRVKFGIVKVQVGGGKGFAENLGFKDCFIFPTTEIIGVKNLTIGSNTWISGGCKFFAGDAGIKIGSNVAIADSNTFITNNHNYKSDKCLPFDEVNYSYPIEIGDAVWIGMKCIVLGGVKIGKGAVIAAGSVVTKSVPEYAVVAGNPARIVGWRDKEIFDRLIKTNSFFNADCVQKIIVKNNFKPFLKEGK